MSGLLLAFAALKRRMVLLVSHQQSLAHGCDTEKRGSLIFSGMVKHGSIKLPYREKRKCDPSIVVK